MAASTTRCRSDCRSDYLRSLGFTTGLLTWNVTLRTWTFNLPAAVTCPGRSAWCDEHCYACKGNFTAPSVAEALGRRLNATLDLDAFVDALCQEIDTSGATLIRIHSSGDFYSLDYLKAWQDVARAMPHVTFFGYTRTWSVDDAYRATLRDCPTNMHVLWSCDASMPDPRPLDPPCGVSWISDDARAGRPNCVKQLTGGRVACDMCKVCTRGRSVVLLPH